MEKILRDHYLPVTNHWKYTYVWTYDDNKSVYPQNWKYYPNEPIFEQAIRGIEPSSKGYKANTRNCDGFTVAMMLAHNKKPISNEWVHNANL